MKLPRMFDFYLVTVVLMTLVGVMAPQQLPVTLYKFSLLSLSGMLGYWLDRSLFPYARPDTLTDSALSAAMIRRAIIVGSTVIGVSLGV